MVLASEQTYRDGLICPTCRGTLNAELGCEVCGQSCVWVSRRSQAWPVLIDAKTSIVDVGQLTETGAESQVGRPGGLGLVRRGVARLMNHPNPVAGTHIAELIRLAKEQSGARRPRILVVGGGEIGGGTQALYDDPDVDVFAFDIYASGNVHVIADAHAIPWAHDSFDGAVVQAVLEHVLSPDEVAAELYRVIRPGGILYADTPFMQQVHEGPYDFTRFTESGHRWLFRKFTRISSGPVSGPATTLLWSIDYFVRALTGNVRAGHLVRLLFFWLPALDKRMPPARKVDGASGVFFLGSKSAKELRPAEIVEHYGLVTGPS